MTQQPTIPNKSTEQPNISEKQVQKTNKIQGQQQPNTKKKGIGYKIGGFFGNLNSIVAKPSKKINDAATQKIQELKQQNLSEQGKGRWSQITTKAKQINHGAAEIIKPASNKLTNITDKIGDKFNKSENTVIKAFRNFGNNLKDSLNQGYRSSMKGKEQPKQQKQQKKPGEEPKVPQSERRL